jgi:hypothetical protein
MSKMSERSMSKALVLLFAFAVLSIGRPASAQISLEGEWTGRYQEDQMDRVPGGSLGDYTGLPINEAARFFADSWDISRSSVPEHQCQVYNVAHIFRGPLQFRVWNERDPDSQEVVATKMYLGTYEQWRTIWMDGRAHPAEYMPHTWMGFSTGEWHGVDLVVTTSHIKAEFLRRDGVPFSDRLTVVEHFIRHGNTLTHVMIATDPVYLSEPMINSEEFVVMDRSNTNWLYNCETAEEVPRLKHDVPGFLPGQNPFLTQYADEVGLPLEAVRGGAETTYPEYRAKLRQMMSGAK